MLRTLRSWFRPLLDAIFKPNLPWDYRWRLLLFQPILLLTYSVTAPVWIFSKAFTVHWIPTREGHSVRALVFKPSSKTTSKSSKLSPLHLDIHGGGFLGGLPEFDAKFCSLLSERTGAVVVSTTYRYAPVHQFPAAIDDIDDIVRFLHENAEELLGADPNLMTVGGFSAGGNLALAACQQPACHSPAVTAMKAAVMFYAPIDLRLRPREKPRPASFPKYDPIAFVEPLFDSYSSKVRAGNMSNPRLSPIVADVNTLPQDMLLVIAAIDILAHEQLTFAERVKQNIEERGTGTQRVVSKVSENGFHGWLELPFKLMEKDRQKVYRMVIDFLEETYKKHGWSYQAD